MKTEWLVADVIPEWLVTDVTVVGSPDRRERDILGMIWCVFWPIQATFVVREPLCYVGIPSWAIDPENLNSPCRELSNGGLGVVIAFWFVGKLIFRWLVLDVQSSCNENRVVGCQCNSCPIPWQSTTCYIFCGWFWLGTLVANSGRICGGRATLWCRNPLLSPNNFLLRVIQWKKSSWLPM